MSARTWLPTACAISVSLLASCQSTPLHAGDATGEWLRELMASQPDRFGYVLDAADELRLKIELAVVYEDSGGQPTLERFRFDAGPEYFYPASTVKTCSAVAAALQLRQVESRARLDVPLGLDTPLRFHPLFRGEALEDADESHLAGGTITLGHEMRKVFLVSDNAANNRLYEFAGNEFLNQTMRSAGLASTRVLHRLSEFRSPQDQLRTPRVVLMQGGEPVAAVPQRSSGLLETNADLTGTAIGIGYQSDGQVVDGPMSFLHKNYVSLRDLQDLHVMLLRPDVRIPGRMSGQGFDLRPDDREFMGAAMAETPGASRDPVYDPAEFPDDYSKFLAPGIWRALPREAVTIRDKVGRAYGFSTTNSEVTERSTGRTYFLSATIYTNPNGILNDGVYDYDRADRFFADLGELVTRQVFQQ